MMQNPIVSLLLSTLILLTGFGILIQWERHATSTFEKRAAIVVTTVFRWLVLGMTLMLGICVLGHILGLHP